jgi:hypothetical protein
LRGDRIGRITGAKRREHAMVGNKHIVYGVHVRDRMQDATKVQDLFSEYGCYIKTRIGLHEVQGEFCSPGGVILLEMFGDETMCTELRDKLSAFKEVEVKELVFEH